jgi:hypothetical protein
LGNIFPQKSYTGISVLPRNFSGGGAEKGAGTAGNAFPENFIMDRANLL